MVSSDSPMAVRKTRRTTILISIMLIAFSILGWDYWHWRCHRASLDRLRTEVKRRQLVDAKLQREEVPALLVGSPRTRSESHLDRQIDYYTWRGIIHNFHICVESSAEGDVLQAENSLFAGGDPLGPDTSAVRRQASVPAAKIEAAMAHAEEFFRKSGDDTNEFRGELRSIYAGLPEVKVSTVKGQLHWNSFQFSRRQQRLFAVRFSAAAPVDLDYLLSGNRMMYYGIVPVAEGTVGSPEIAKNDFEPNVQFEGAKIPSGAGVYCGSLSLRRLFPMNNCFIFWFFTDDEQPTVDFECRCLFFLTEAANSKGRFGVHDICDHIGLPTKVPKHPPTPDGVRAALQTLNARFDVGDVRPCTPGRLLRPVRSALPERKVSTTAGEAQWQRVDFSHGPCAAARIRIPGAPGQKFDLYGAILTTQASFFGWDRYGSNLGDFLTRMALDVRLPEPNLPPPNRLTLFSQTFGQLEAGEDFVLFHGLLDQPAGPVFVTLTLLPHPEDEDHAPAPITVRQPWSCGKLLGVDFPPPAAAEGSTVLGWHEYRITQFQFSPDNRRLVSVDLRGHANIWNVASRNLEGRIDLPSWFAQTVIVDPESRTLLVFDRYQKSVLRYLLETREKAGTLDIGWKNNERLEAATFGPQPHQFVGVPMPHVKNSLGGWEDAPRFSAWDLNANQLTEHTPDVRGKITSLIFLPRLNMFAAGRTRSVVNADSRSFRCVSSVQLWPPDFVRPTQELLLGEHLLDHEGHERNPVQLSQSQDGRRLAAICQRGHLKVWDVGTFAEVLSAPSTEQLLAVSLSPDGEQVATTLENGTAISVWMVSDGQQKQLWQTDEIPITHVAHSPDGRWVATANTDGVIRLWDNAK